MRIITYLADLVKDNMKYRPNRRYIDESMLEVKEFKDTEELSKHLNLNSTDRLSFIYQGYDKRIGWVSFLVCVNNEAVGHSDGAL